MSLSAKLKTAFSFVGVYAFAIVTDPFITIVRLNIERWAEERNHDRLYTLASNPPEWLVKTWEYITGEFGLGFVLGGLLFALWDPLARYAKKLITTPERARRALDDLFAEGVGERNKLLQPLNPYNDAGEREVMEDWNDRVVQKLNDAGVSLGLRSRFRTLNLFQPQHQPAAGRSPPQIMLEAIWNEKLNRLREIIDGFRK